jgi:hypothetical protein
MAGVFLYRLVVTKPEGSEEPGWAPEGWEEICEARGWWDPSAYGENDPPPFGWPKRRLYLSAASAEYRAGLMRDYGATVVVERSDAVTWPA